ncbi:MAG: hypothetical protein JNM93_03970 [Bacteriovoracaceae bacterium]|nr:hypothetical protein [Bacteriovoracaceae bacterium]
MNLKYFFLLILFIANFSTTVFADSLHVDVEASSKDSCTEHSASVDSDSNKQDSSENCPEHDCCHQDHVHNYLLPKISVDLSIVSTNYSFPANPLSFASNFLDIIKPPLV